MIGPDGVTYWPRSISVKAGDLGTLIHKPDTANNYYSGDWVAFDNGITSAWSYGSNLEDAEPEPKAEPQPVIFDSPEEAATSTIIDVLAEKGHVRIAANYRTVDMQKSRKAPIFIEFKTDEDTAFGVLSVDEAKQVAVALFNQILYHEGLRNNG
jgi:hypothetical protein